MNHISAEHGCCRDQQAGLEELRAAISLSHLWLQLGEPREARQLLAPVYG